MQQTRTTQCLAVVLFLIAATTNRAFAFAPTATTTGSSSSLQFSNKLWDRLDIEPDEEPHWYLINCVATCELELLSQCQLVCANLEDADAVHCKFVVPVEQHTRSHGARKMVTEQKVKYPGYVFAHVQLCPPVYQAIQELDLCRSWMGTIHRQGHRKLPPIPLALNEEEIENFGLNEMKEQKVENTVDATAKADEIMGVLYDDGEDDDNNEHDPLKGVDRKDLKQYKGLKVDDMIKVTGPGKFFHEDGIVRRLKLGKIFVRFYTYGSMYEEWLQPDEVRKLSGEEILRGLAGPQQPITQSDFDGPEDNGRNNDRRRNNNYQQDRGRDNGFQSSFGDARNRRQDRTANRFQKDTDKGEENWSWYQQQQEKNERRANPRGRNDNRASVQTSKWNDEPRGKPRSFSRDSPRDRNTGPKRETTVRKSNDNRRTEAAIDGKNDWSAFVSTPSPVKTEKTDDFFSSLTTSLKHDLNRNDSAGSSATTSDLSGSKKDKANDFYDRLLSDLYEEGDSGGRSKPSKKKSDDSFFADLLSSMEADEQSTTSSKKKNFSPRQNDTGGRSKPAVEAIDVRQDDDFFATLEADLEATISSKVDDSFATREADSEATISPAVKKRPEKEETYKGKWSPARVKPPRNTPSEATPKAPSSSSSMNKSELSSRTVPILKEMLRERGLKVGGKKAELVERLLQS